MSHKKSTKSDKTKLYETEIASGVPREIPETMKTKKALAFNQNQLAVERTEFSKIRTDLAFTNSRLAAEQTHLAYLRTIVSLIGSAATISKALPILGISQQFTGILTTFLLIAAFYFIYKDITTYPRIRRHLKEMEQQASELSEKTENMVFRLHDDI